MAEVPYDAVLVLSFGGPERPEDVVPFLENVTKGRGVPRERLVEVGRHYDLFGGRSPINDQNRALIAALEVELAAAGIDLPVYFGNRNWHPMLADTVARMAADGVQRVVAFATSAWSSYSSCRQYREDIAGARDAVGPTAPQIDKLRPFFNHPGFIGAQADFLNRVLGGRGDFSGRTLRLIFTAHSIPGAMAERCDYEAQLFEASRLVSEATGTDVPFDVVYQSRSGPPQVPWLGPDVSDHLVTLADAGVDEVVVVPVGFVSDHVEVLYDLDIVAAADAAKLGLGFHRVPTVGTHPRFVSMIRELIEERSQPDDGRRVAIGRLGARPDRCPDGCCPAPVRPPARPAATHR